MTPIAAARLFAALLLCAVLYLVVTDDGQYARPEPVELVP